MNAIFYIKKLTTMLTLRRIPIGMYANNIGAPVVSFYTQRQLVGMTKSFDDCDIIDINTEKIKIVPLWRLALITQRADITITVKKLCERE
jgi:hypothetical protein